jgi:hypothetical protein
MSSYYILLDNSKFVQLEDVYGEFHVKPVSVDQATLFTDKVLVNKTYNGINAGESGIYSYISDYKAIRILENL